MAFTTAIVCPPSATFAQGLSTSQALGAPELRAAALQHADYCRALRDCGLEVLELSSAYRSARTKAGRGSSATSSPASATGHP